MQTDERTILHHELVISVRLHDRFAHPVQKMSYTYTDHSAICESKDDFFPTPIWREEEEIN